MSAATGHFFSRTHNFRAEWGINASRIACVLVAVLTMGGAGLDRITHPDKFGEFFLYRSITAALAMLLWGLSFSTQLKDYPKLLFLTPMALAAINVQLMIQRLPEGYASSYYAGLNLCILGFAITVTLPLFETALVSFGVVGLWLVGALVGERPIELRPFFGNFFFLNGTAAIAVGSTLIRNRVAEREYESFYAHRHLQDVDETLACRPLDLAAYVKRHGGDFATSARAKGIETQLDIASAPLEVYVDEKKLDKILMNLLSNAYKFTPDGGRITIALAAESQQVRLSVADSGIGIAPDQLKHVFGRFAQADDSAKRAYEGAGIGLALVKDYAELHGGRVTVRSELGAGTRFEVCLPLGRAHLQPDQIVDVEAATVGAPLPDWQLPLKTPAALSSSAERTGATLERLGDALAPGGVAEALAAQNQSALDPPAARPSVRPVLGLEAHARVTHAWAQIGQDARVLVVDDNPEIRSDLRGLLQSHYQVRLAVDGADALAKAREWLPHLVLSDVMMPRMTGDELCAAIKAEEGSLARTPVMLITARADEEAKGQGLALGADDYLFKPFIPEELLLRVRNMLVAHHYERALERAHAELSDDLAVAKLVQRAALPKLDLPAPFVAAALFRPRDEVGGDLYHVQAFDCDGVRMFLADASGHGVQGALQAEAVLKEYEAVSTQTDSPGAVLGEVNRRLHQRYGGRVSFVGSCVDFQPATAGTAVFRYAQAGGLPLALVSPTSWQPLPFTKGMVGGLLRRATYREAEGELGVDMSLLVYSDGLDEQKNVAGITFAAELRWAAQQAASGVGVKAVVHALGHAFDDFRHDVPQQDDLTVLCFRLTAGKG
ncbi:MAG: ATP-binding protein [Polyangiales bacterium]